MFCPHSKVYCSYETTSQKLKLSSKAFNKGRLEQNTDELLEKSQKLYDETVNTLTTNGGFRTRGHIVSKHEQDYWRPSCF